MNNIERLMSESHSGPELYISIADYVITLGSLLHIMDKASHALDGTRLFLKQIEEKPDVGDEEKSMAISLQVVVEFALECVSMLYPDATIRGQDIRRDPERGSKRIIIDKDADEIMAVKRRKRAQKAERQ